MERVALVAMGLLFGVACSSGNGQGSSLSIPPFDGGPVPVYLDGGGAPAIPPDGAAACPAGACDYQTGTGCAGAMPSCLPALSGNMTAPACYPAGTAQPGAACVQANDCTAGHICAGGACRKLCCGGDWTGCDDASEHCLESLAYTTDAGLVPTGAMLCYPVNTCDALNPSSCDLPGITCQIADPTGATACIAEGTGTSGEPCPCKGGYVCVQPPNAGTVCVRLCKAVTGGGAPYCQANEGICTHYTRDPAGVGECQPPSGP
jgi:hypothetical protein